MSSSMVTAKSDPTGALLAYSEGSSGELKVAAINKDGLCLAQEPPAGYRAHLRPINGIAWSADGRFIATAGSDTFVIIWRVARDLSLKIERVLRGHRGEALCVEFAPNCYTLASGSIDGETIMWNLKLGSRIAGYRTSFQPIITVEYACAGQMLMCGCYDGTTRLINLVDRRIVRTLSAYGLAVNKPEVLGAKVSPNGRYVFTRYTTGQTVLIDAVSEDVLCRYAEFPETEQAVKTEQEIKIESRIKNGATIAYGASIKNEPEFDMERQPLIGDVRVDAEAKFLYIATSSGILKFDVKTTEVVDTFVEGVPVIRFDLHKGFGVASGIKGIHFFRFPNGPNPENSKDSS